MDATAAVSLAQNSFELVDLMPIAGILLIIMALMLGIRKKRRRLRDRGTAREQLERVKQQSGVRGDLETLMVEIEQLAKRMGGQLDAKAMAIEKLLAEAEQTIARLEQARDGAGGSGSPAGPGSAPSSGPAPPDDARPPPESDPAARRVCALADEGMSPDQIAHQLDEHVGKVELILALRDAQ